MKKSLKILSLALSLSLAVGTTTGLAFTASAISGGDEAVPAPVAETKAEAQVYLVPGEGNSLEGTPLTADETAALHMEGSVYKAGAAGTQLPTPTTTKKDKNNTPFTFNGWWTVVDATVTYFTTVPEVEETTYLYADFRAALSQHQEPVAPSAGGGQVSYANYMKVTRAETDTVEYIPLYVSGSDVPNAVQAGYGKPVQWYNEWFTLAPGDLISFYVSGVYGSQPVAAPRRAGGMNQCALTMESSGQYGMTAMYLQPVNGDYGTTTFFDAYSKNEAPVMSYTGSYAKREHTFRCYIKFYNEGGTMTLYMENMDAKLGLGEMI